MDVLTATPDSWVENEQEHSAYLNNLDNWHMIPLVNVNEAQNLPNGKLVRFQGMVQDMLNPEYCFEKYEVIHEITRERCMRNGRYKDFVQCKDNEVINYESKLNVTKERQTLVMISTPALNDWVQQIQKQKFKITSCDITELSNNVNKRILDVNNPASLDQEQGSPNQNKKLCTVKRQLEQHQQSSTVALPPTVLENHSSDFPLPERPGKMFHVNLYENYDKVKLNDVLEVVGFLFLDEKPLDGNRENAMETDSPKPPASLVPRIQCVTWRSIFHNNPLVEKNFQTENVSGKKNCSLFSEDVCMEPSVMENLKKELLTVLTQLLLGDALAAEYFIYYLISKVYWRQDLIPIGKFSMNISKVPVNIVPDYGKELYNFIELLVPKSHYVPMTLEVMNKLTVTPKKDYDCDKIRSGLLQLSNNTSLVLDETKLSAGQLNESGVRAVAAFSSTIKNQKVFYDFVYYQMEFDCDIPILILSEGKSFLPNDIHVPLNTDQVCVDTFHEIIEAVRYFLKPELLNDIRKYLTLARHGCCEMKNGLDEPIQNEFVRLRQTDPSIAADDLHSLLVLTRLICLSEGKRVMDLESWERACRLESERRNRLK